MYANRAACYCCVYIIYPVDGPQFSQHVAHVQGYHQPSCSGSESPAFLFRIRITSLLVPDPNHQPSCSGSGTPAFLFRIQITCYLVADPDHQLSCCGSGLPAICLRIQITCHLVGDPNQRQSCSGSGSPVIFYGSGSPAILLRIRIPAILLRIWISDHQPSCSGSGSPDILLRIGITSHLVVDPDHLDACLILKRMRIAQLHLPVFSLLPLPIFHVPSCPHLCFLPSPLSSFSSKHNLHILVQISSCLFLKY